MIKIINIVFLILSVSISAAEFDFKPSYANSAICEPELQECFQLIKQLPEANQLINTIQKQGGIRIAVNRIQLPNKFGAFWDLDNRIIYVNLSGGRSKGELIGSILFELHNALVSSKIEHLDDLARQGKINRDSYTEAVERLEYQNALNASSLSVKGIQQGIFPKTAFLPVYQTFEEHYRVQQESGHSAWISHTYDQITRF